MKKGCFFCGSTKVKRSKNGEGHYVKCEGCGHILAGFDTKSEATKEWSNQDKTAYQGQVAARA